MIRLWGDTDYFSTKALIRQFASKGVTPTPPKPYSLFDLSKYYSMCKLMCENEQDEAKIPVPNIPPQFLVSEIMKMVDLSNRKEDNSRACYQFYLYPNDYEIKGRKFFTHKYFIEDLFDFLVKYRANTLSGTLGILIKGGFGNPVLSLSRMFIFNCFLRAKKPPPVGLAKVMATDTEFISNQIPKQHKCMVITLESISHLNFADFASKVATNETIDAMNEDMLAMVLECFITHRKKRLDYAHDPKIRYIMQTAPRLIKRLNNYLWNCKGDVRKRLEHKSFVKTLAVELVDKEDMSTTDYSRLFLASCQLDTVIEINKDILTYLTEHECTRTITMVLEILWVCFNSRKIIIGSNALIKGVVNYVSSSMKDGSVIAQSDLVKDAVMLMIMNACRSGLESRYAALDGVLCFVNEAVVHRVVNVRLFHECVLMSVLCSNKSDKAILIPLMGRYTPPDPVRNLEFESLIMCLYGLDVLKKYRVFWKAQTRSKEGMFRNVIWSKSTMRRVANDVQKTVLYIATCKMNNTDPKKFTKQKFVESIGGWASKDENFIGQRLEEMYKIVCFC